MKLRAYILLFLLVFGLTPLILALLINLPLVLDRTTLFYQRAYLQNLRADFRDLDQHLASRHEMIRLLSKLPEPGLILGEQGDADQIDLSRARYTTWINQIFADQRAVIQILFVGDDPGPHGPLHVTHVYARGAHGWRLVSRHASAADDSHQAMADAMSYTLH